RVTRASGTVSWVRRATSTTVSTPTTTDTPRATAADEPSTANTEARTYGQPGGQKWGCSPKVPFASCAATSAYSEPSGARGSPPKSPHATRPRATAAIPSRATQERGVIECKTKGELIAIRLGARRAGRQR